jgi:UDP-N-acetylmuramoyl-tripeptide--D-alanyl-D-alanine ligase
MRELGDNSAVEHQKIVDLISTFSFEKVLLCGEHFGATKSSFQTFSDTNDLLEFLKLNPITNNYILIKGSRGMKLEGVIEWL